MTTAIRFETEMTIKAEYTDARGNNMLGTAFFKGEEATGIIKGGIITAYSEKLGTDVELGREKVYIMDRWEMETCKVCGEDTEQGYIVSGDIHCSEECLEKVMTDEEYNELYDSGDAYWTSWYGEEY